MSRSHIGSIEVFPLIHLSQIVILRLLPGQQIWLLLDTYSLALRA